MTTRFYLTTDPAPYTPATVRGTWNDAAGLGANTYDLSRTKAGASTAMARPETSTTTNWKVLLHRHVSGPLAGGTVPAGAAPFVHTQARMQSSSTASMRVCIHIYFTIGDSDTVRATYVNTFTGATTFAVAPALTAFSYNSATAAAAPIQAGDRMVVELGYVAVNTVATSFTGTMQIGGTAGDLATTGTTGVTTNSPWLEWPAAADPMLAAYTPPAASSMPMSPSTYARLRPFLVR